MFPRAVRIASIHGIDVRVDPSWIVIALLVVWSFTRRFQLVNQHALGWALALAVLATVLFFGSVLVHELAHALEAQHRDITVGGITLFLFGGVTETHVEAKRPRDEFVMAAVGPYASLVAGALFGLMATAASGYPDALARGLADVFGLLGWLNVGLAIFNLIPGSPLDGGRVVRSALWAALGDRVRAARYAARAGQTIAMGLIGVGIWVAFTLEGRFVDGLWFTLIGWFMLSAAQVEIVQADLRQVLRGRTVRTLLGPDPVLIPEDRPLSLLVDTMAADPAHQVFPVVDTAGERIVGALPLKAVRDVAPPDRPFRTAGELARPIGEIPAVDVDLPLEDLLDQHREHGLVRVMRGPELWGLLTRDDIGRALTRLHELEHGRRPRTAAARRASGSRR